MNKILIKVIKTIIKLLQEVIILIPITILFLSFDEDYKYIGSSMLKIILLTLAIYVIGILIGKFSNNKVLLIRYAGIGVVALIISLIVFNSGYTFYASIALLIFYLYRGTDLYYQKTRSCYYIVSIILYCVVAFAIRKGIISIPYQSIFTLFGVLSLIIGLFNLNKNQMQSADEGNTGLLYHDIKKYNYHLVIVISFLVFLISIGYQFYNDIINYVKKGIGYIISFIFNLFQNDNTVMPEIPMDNGQFQLPYDDTQKSDSLFGKIVYYFFLVVCITVLLIGCVILILKLYKLIKKLANSIMSKLMVTGSVELPYEEVKEQLMDVQKLKEKYSENLKNAFRQIFSKPINWNELNNIEKIRFLYKNTIERLNKKGYKPSNASTPNEIVNDITKSHYKDSLMNSEFINVYNKARYSEHKINDEEVNSYHSFKGD